MSETVVTTVSKMNDSVVTTAESITDYIQSFNKEIGETGEQATTTTTTTATVATISSNSDGTNQVIADTIYIDGKEITGNIVLADQVAGDATDQGGNFQTFMVMNDQQYMLIMANETDQPATDGEPTQTLVAVEEEQQQEEEGGEEPTPAPDSTPTRDGNRLAANVETPTRRTRFHSKRIKEEVEDSRNDISVYDFNDQPARNQQPGGSSSTTSSKQKRASAAAAAAAASAAAASISSDAVDASESANIADDSDEFKTPTKHRGRPLKNSDSTSGRKIKSGSGSLVLNTTSGSSNSNVHVCTYCAYTSTKRYLLSRHLKSHSEDRPHKCGICERGFKTLASLQNHVNTHTGVRPHQCKFCEAAFTTSGELVRHIRYRHTHEKPHRCTECDYASVELSKLKRHMRCHTGERPYQCPHCTYASPDTYKLKRHLRIHTGEKPYLCDVCHQRFTQSNSLKAHKLIHTGNKPIFKCEFCPTTCGRKTDLRIHVQKLHTSDKMLTCKRCDQSFPDRYQFKLHLKTHEGEKCFKCDLCNYASVSARHLESHMLIHTDQKPFLCEACDMSFRQKQLLKRHRNLYHNPTYVPPVPKEKTHECGHPECHKTFRHKGNLIRHMSFHDPDTKKNRSKDPCEMGSSQLIDDEYYEGEEDYDTNDESGSVSIVADSSALLDSNSNTEGTIAITLDQHTQQLINSNEQLMLVVVPETQEATVTAANGQSTIVTVTTTAPTTSTPRIISRSARVTRSAAKASNNDLQVIFDSVAETKPTIANNNDESQSSTQPQQQAPQLAFDASEINMEEQMQKRKDLDECFGFKDEDDEDEIILSMPAVHGQ